MEDYEKQRIELMELSIPVIEWINKNYHPHMKLIIDCNGYELVEGTLAMQMWKEGDDTSNFSEPKKNNQNLC
jgi:hypothetical protein